MITKIAVRLGYDKRPAMSTAVATGIIKIHLWTPIHRNKADVPNSANTNPNVWNDAVYKT